ncbi:MAG: ATP-dependent DNA helicase [Alphaproteobacteria bacterium]
MDGSPRIFLPEAPALAVGVSAAVWLSPDGEIDDAGPAAVAARIRAGAVPFVCHAPALARRLDIAPFRALDLLELFAFVHPARFCVPTPHGLAEALGLPLPDDLAAAAETLPGAAVALLRALGTDRAARGARPVAWAMGQGGWPWAPAVLAALGEDPAGRMTAPGSGLDVWRQLPEWSEHAPPPPAGSAPVRPDEARARLAELLGATAEPRPSQADYASAMTAAFAPRDAAGIPHVVLAEAGTGVGKTLGYIAPASLWAEKNEAPVWLSTYTRALQHQIDRELDRLYPDPAVKATRVVLRKGRENYFCLLNMEEAVRAVAVRRSDAVPLGLMARWAARSRDGDMTGGDFPSWLVDLLGPAATVGLADRRGECIFAACAHYSRCYIERGIRRARRAELVVANHALVMIQAARGLFEGSESGGPTRFVFDEGHHVFDAADSAFSAHLSGREASELRRWLRGNEGRGRSRARGLKRRVEDLLNGDPALIDALEAILDASAVLPDEGWHQRCAEDRPRGAAETFLARVRTQVYARSSDSGSPYALESDIADPVPGLIDAAAALEAALGRLERPIRQFRERLSARLEEEAADMDTPTRIRIESTARALQYRGEETLRSWRDMLAELPAPTPPAFVDWFAVDRIEGRDVDIGMHRHWIDPTRPFAEVFASAAHGMAITSATLRDGSGEVEADWRLAETRTGAQHLPAPAIRAAVPSPFDYAEQTRVFIVNDVRKDDLGQVASAYRALFQASGGGALGLFTAITRLRAVHGRIARDLDRAGLPLYAQHVDALNLATLIDIFRAERDACLLGTDAVRDGVDVPGESLRLIVFDRVPWPRPTILHRARRAAFGARGFDDSLTRLRLKQAYGRLVRRAGDRGVFVMLDPMLPSRLLGAFPDGVVAQRVGLAEAVAAMREFFASDPLPHAERLTVGTGGALKSPPRADAETEGE